MNNCNNCNRSNLCFRESSLRVDTHRLSLKPHPTPSFTSPYISSLYSLLDRVIENIWVNSDTDEHLLLTNTITEGKNKKQNYNWHTATAFNEVNWNKTAEDDSPQTALPAPLITNQTDFISVIYLRINIGLYFISNVLIDLTILVISVCFSYALDPWQFNVSFFFCCNCVCDTHLIWQEKLSHITIK